MEIEEKRRRLESIRNCYSGMNIDSAINALSSGGFDIVILTNNGMYKVIEKGQEYVSSLDGKLKVKILCYTDNDGWFDYLSWAVENYIINKIQEYEFYGRIKNIN